LALVCDLLISIIVLHLSPSMKEALKLFTTRMTIRRLYSTKTVAQKKTESPTENCSSTGIWEFRFIPEKGFTKLDDEKIIQKNNKEEGKKKDTRLKRDQNKGKRNHDT
jgi:hypothetical protein